MGWCLIGEAEDHAEFQGEEEELLGNKGGASWDGATVAGLIAVRLHTKIQE